MATPHFETKKIMIWGMTYPELSTKHFETVCTGGVLEDGSPVRLYPIPYRYLNQYNVNRFHKYDWIKVGIRKSNTDTRPETYKINPETIEILSKVDPNPKNEWAARADVIFRNKNWQFDSMVELYAAQASRQTSLGIVAPLEVCDIRIFQRPDDEWAHFKTKMSALKSKLDLSLAQQKLFDETLPSQLKDLEYISARQQIIWKCKSPSCDKKDGHKIHQTQVLDWELMELQRKSGQEKAIDRLAEVCTVEDYTLKFYLGNFHDHRNRFSIVGLWYPKKSLTPDLFHSS